MTAPFDRSNMAAEGVCPFPLPPTQYYKLYTDENVENRTAPEPPPIVDGAYAMFGASFEVNMEASLFCFISATELN